MNEKHGVNLNNVLRMNPIRDSMMVQEDNKSDFKKKFSYVFSDNVDKLADTSLRFNTSIVFDGHMTPLKKRMTYNVSCKQAVTPVKSENRRTVKPQVQSDH